MIHFVRVYSKTPSKGREFRPFLSTGKSRCPELYLGSPLEGEILQVLEVRPLMCQMIQMMAWLEQTQVENTPQKTILSMHQEL